MTGEPVGEPAIGYRDFASAVGGTVFATTDGQLLQVDPATLRPIGLPFGTVGEDERLLLDQLGRHLAIASGNPLGDAAIGDQSVRLYDVAGRIQLGDAIELGDSDTSLGWVGAAFRFDGMELAIDTAQGIVVWDLDPAHWVDAACDVAGRNLIPAEWDQYIGDIAPYRATCPQFALA
jgi:hypothetical protein